MNTWVNFDDIKKKWLKDKDFVTHYQDLELEYKISLELVRARVDAGLTQEDIAKMLGTKQSVIARLESGKSLPSLKTLYKYAQVTHKKVDVQLI